MIYSFSLSQVSIALGILYILFTTLCLWKFQPSKDFFLKLHRNEIAGYISTAIAVIWALWLTATIDLMEYSHLRNTFLLIVILLSVLTVLFLKDYLFVRSLGVILILITKVLLDAAFLREEPSRFLITIIAYLTAIKGMVFIAAPYLFRDSLIWFYRNDRLARSLYILGSLFGIILILFGIFIY